MTDLAQLGLSLEAKPMLDGLAKVNTALANTAAHAEKLVATVKTATGQMAAAFKSVGSGGLSGQAQKQMTSLVGGFQVANARIRALVSDRVKQTTAEVLAADKIQLNSAIMTGREILAAHKKRAAEEGAIEAARAKQAMALRMQPILSTGSVGLPTKTTSAFNQPEPLAYTPSGIASVDKMREALARLRVEEAALHAARRRPLTDGGITNKEYARGMEELTKQTNLAVAGNTRARGAFRQTAAAVASATFEITGAIFGITSALSILASPAIFGFKLLKTLEDTKLGLSGILISMGEINGQAIKLPQALEIADGMTKRLQQSAMKYGVDMIALADTTKAVLASGLGGGLALKQVEEIALLGSIAVKTIGLDARQSVQEIRDLVAGGIQAGSSTLAVALGVTNEDVKRWREAGTLFDNLKIKMKGFQETAILKQDTLNGAWTIFVQKIQLLLANGPAFDLIKQKLTDISNAIGGFNVSTGQFEFNPQLVKTVEEYYAAFKQVVEVLADAGRVAVALIPPLIELGKAFLLLKAINLSATIGRGLTELTSSAMSATKAIVTGVGDATSKVDKFKGVLSGIGQNPIVQVIGVEIAWNVGQAIGGGLYKSFQGFFDRELEKVNKLIYNFGGSIKATLLDSLAAVFQWGPLSRLIGIPEFFSNMADEVRREANKATAVVAKASAFSKWGIGGSSPWSKVDPAAFVTGKTGAGGDPGSGKKRGGGADPQIAFMDSLRKEAATLGMSEEALKRYEASKMKLTPTNRRLADQLITTIFAFKAEQEIAKAANEEAQKAIEANEALIKSAEEKVAETEKSIKQVQFETTLLGMNTDERYRAIAANQLSENTYLDGNVALAERIVLLQKEQEYQSRLTSLLSNTQKAKTDDFMANIAAADRFLFDGGNVQQYEEMIKSITEGAKDNLKALDSFAENAAKNIQDSMAEFLFNPFDKGLKGMVQGFGQTIQKMIAEAVAADLARRLFGGLADQGKTQGTGWIGGALDWLGNTLGLADGGAFGPGGVRAFASGGIMGAAGGLLTQPTMFPMANGGIGLGGEAGVEAVMPLKRGSDGKLGVSAGNSGGPRHNITVVVQGNQAAPDVRRAAGQGAREGLMAFERARRYG